MGEKLSREGSTVQETGGEGLQPDTAALEPGTPEGSRPGKKLINCSVNGLLKFTLENPEKEKWIFIQQCVLLQ